MTAKFNDIRPYTDAEIPAAMHRIAESEHLGAVCDFVFPGKPLSEVQHMLRSYTTIRDFQLGAMYAFNSRVLTQSIDRFTCSGIERLDPAGSYLFVSNHRDIVMDSSLLQFALHSKGFRTTEITFGSNLMSSQLMIDIGRSNKMFKVARGETPREFLKTSMHLSEYIRHTIVSRGESVWIAQRNGRTKDGNDVTDQGIIKMFCMSCAKDPVRAIDELNIVPVAISYQWEPCDILKTRELYLSRDRKYVKQKGEDLNSILTGFTQWKGCVNIHVCRPLGREEHACFAGDTPNRFYKKIAQLIDGRIYDNYRLWNTNLIAQDMRSGSDQYAGCYTKEEKEEFAERLRQVLHQVDGDKDIISAIFLGIYANPTLVCRPFMQG